MTEIVCSYKDHGVYVAHIDGKFVGRARVNDADNYLATLYVHEGYRRKGVGRALFAFIVAHRGAPLNKAPAHTKNAEAIKFSASLPDSQLIRGGRRNVT